MKQKEFFLNSLNFCFAHEEEIVCFLFTPFNVITNSIISKRNDKLM